MRIGGTTIEIGAFTGGLLRRAEIAAAVQQHPVRVGLWAFAHCAPALSGLVERVGRAGGYDPVACGEAIGDVLLRQGVSMADLGALALEGLQRLAPPKPAQPEPVQAPPDPKDPYRGLRLWGKTYAEWGRTARPDRAEVERMTWADCGRAIAEGRIAEVVAQLNADGVPAIWEG